MKKSDESKEKIINATTSLIMESEGDINGINTRIIAEKADVGIGLINYHFQTKEALIEICVERIIKNIIENFKSPSEDLEQTALYLLKHTTKKVANFLIENPAASKISILSDLKNPQRNDNTILTAKGFSHIIHSYALSENEGFILAFTLTSIIQMLFLRKNMSKELFGYDLNLKEERDKFIDLLINIMFGRIKCK